MKCKLCLKHNTGRNSFTKGTDHFKKDIIIKHVKSRAHTQAITASSLYSSLRTHLENKLSKELIASDLYRLVKIVWFLLKEKIAFIKYEKVVELTQALGVKFDSRFYHTRYGFQNLLIAINRQLKRNLHERLKNAKNFTLLCDCATDICNTNYMISFVMFYDERDMMVRCEFLDISELIRGTGKCMYDSLVKSMSKFGLTPEKLMCLTTDGASANTGEEEGLVGCFKDVNPRILSIHCISHRLQLLVKDVIDEVEELKHINDILNQMHTFFRASSVRNNILKIWASILDEDRYEILATLEIRWFSFYRALTNIRRNLPILRMALKDLSTDKSPATAATALELLEKISTFKFLASLHLIEDIFADLNIINQHFQQTFITAMKVMPLVEMLKRHLQSSYLDGSMGPSLRKFLDHLTIVDKNNRLYKWENYEIELDGTIEEEAMLLMEEIVNTLIKRIDIRFPDAEAMSKSSIFSLPKICHAVSIVDYGMNEIEFYADLYGDPKYLVKEKRFLDPVLKRQGLINEWRSFKFFVVENYSSVYVQSTKNRANIQPEKSLRSEDAKELSLLNGILIHYEEVYPNLVALLKIVLCLAGSNAISERGFSAQHLIQTKTRNSLETKNLKKALRISLYNETLDENDYNQIHKEFQSIVTRKDSLIK
jgi:hypothetical protein